MSDNFKTYKSQEEWQSDIDSIIGKRLGELRSAKSELEAANEVLSKLMEEYGATAPSDISAKVSEKIEKTRAAAIELSDRVIEGAMDAQSALKIQRDPSMFSFDELDEITNRVRRGEQVEF